MDDDVVDGTVGLTCPVDKNITTPVIDTMPSFLLQSAVQRLFTLSLSAVCLQVVNTLTQSVLLHKMEPVTKKPKKMQSAGRSQLPGTYRWIHVVRAVASTSTVGLCTQTASGMRV
jgi:hypothetical protein